MYRSLLLNRPLLLYVRKLKRSENCEIVQRVAELPAERNDIILYKIFSLN